MISTINDQSKDLNIIHSSECIINIDYMYKEQKIYFELKNKSLTAENSVLCKRHISLNKIYNSRNCTFLSELAKVKLKLNKMIQTDGLTLPPDNLGPPPFYRSRSPQRKTESPVRDHRSRSPPLLYRENYGVSSFKFPEPAPIVQTDYANFCELYFDGTRSKKHRYRKNTIKRVRSDTKLNCTTTICRENKKLQEEFSHNISTKLDKVNTKINENVSPSPFKHGHESCRKRHRSPDKTRKGREGGFQIILSPRDPQSQSSFENKYIHTCGQYYNEHVKHKPKKIIVTSNTLQPFTKPIMKDTEIQTNFTGIPILKDIFNNHMFGKHIFETQSLEKSIDSGNGDQREFYRKRKRKKLHLTMTFFPCLEIKCSSNNIEMPAASERPKMPRRRINPDENSITDSQSIETKEEKITVVDKQTTVFPKRTSNETKARSKSRSPSPVSKNLELKNKILHLFSDSESSNDYSKKIDDLCILIRSLLHEKCSKNTQQDSNIQSIKKTEESIVEEPSNKVPMHKRNKSRSVSPAAVKSNVSTNLRSEIKQEVENQLKKTLLQNEHLVNKPILQNEHQVKKPLLHNEHHVKKPILQNEHQMKKHISQIEHQVKTPVLEQNKENQIDDHANELIQTENVEQTVKHTPQVPKNVFFIPTHVNQILKNYDYDVPTLDQTNFSLNDLIKHKQDEVSYRLTEMLDSPSLKQKYHVKSENVSPRLVKTNTFFGQKGIENNKRMNEEPSSVTFSSKVNILGEDNNSKDIKMYSLPKKVVGKNTLIPVSTMKRSKTLPSKKYFFKHKNFSNMPEAGFPNSPLATFDSKVSQNLALKHSNCGLSTARANDMETKDAKSKKTSTEKGSNTPGTLNTTFVTKKDNLVNSSFQRRKEYSNKLKMQKKNKIDLQNETAESGQIESTITKKSSNSTLQEISQLSSNENLNHCTFKTITQLDNIKNCESKSCYEDIQYYDTIPTKEFKSKLPIKTSKSNIVPQDDSFKHTSNSKEEPVPVPNMSLHSVLIRYPFKPAEPTPPHNQLILKPILKNPLKVKESSIEYSVQNLEKKYMFDANNKSKKTYSNSYQFLQNVKSSRKQNISNNINHEPTASIENKNNISTKKHPIDIYFQSESYKIFEQNWKNRKLQKKCLEAREHKAKIYQDNFKCSSYKLKDNLSETASSAANLRKNKRINSTRKKITSSQTSSNNLNIPEKFHYLYNKEYQDSLSELRFSAETIKNENKNYTNPYLIMDNNVHKLEGLFPHQDIINVCKINNFQNRTTSNCKINRKIPKSNVIVSVNSCNICCKPSKCFKKVSKDICNNPSKAFQNMFNNLCGKPLKRICCKQSKTMKKITKDYKRKKKKLEKKVSKVCCHPCESIKSATNLCCKHSKTLRKASKNCKRKKKNIEKKVSQVCCHPSKTFKKVTKSCKRTGKNIGRKVSNVCCHPCKSLNSLCSKSSKTLKKVTKECRHKRKNIEKKVSKVCCHPSGSIKSRTSICRKPSNTFKKVTKDCKRKRKNIEKKVSKVCSKPSRNFKKKPIKICSKPSQSYKNRTHKVCSKSSLTFKNKTYKVCSKSCIKRPSQVWSKSSTNFTKPSKKVKKKTSQVWCKAHKNVQKKTSQVWCKAHKNVKKKTSQVYCIPAKKMKKKPSKVCFLSSKNYKTKESKHKTIYSNLRKRISELDICSIETCIQLCCPCCNCASNKQSSNTFNMKKAKNIKTVPKTSADSKNKNKTKTKIKCKCKSSKFARNIKAFYSDKECKDFLIISVPGYNDAINSRKPVNMNNYSKNMKTHKTENTMGTNMNYTVPKQIQNDLNYIKKPRLRSTVKPWTYSENKISAANLSNTKLINSTNKIIQINYDDKERKSPLKSSLKNEFIENKAYRRQNSIKPKATTGYNTCVNFERDTNITKSENVLVPNLFPRKSSSKKLIKLLKLSSIDNFFRTKGKYLKGIFFKKKNDDS